MTQPDVVAQAADLLEARLQELDKERASLDAEDVRVRTALRSLRPDAYDANGAPAAQTPDETAGPYWRPTFTPEKSKLPVRAAVKLLINGENRAFTPAEIRELLDPDVLGDRTDKQVRNVIRTSLHTLREGGDAYLDSAGRTVAAQWVDNKTTESPSGATEELPESGNPVEGGEARDDDQVERSALQGHDFL